SENGGQTDIRAPIVRAANRAVRLRAAAELVADVVPPPFGVYPRARELLEQHADVICAQRVTGPSISDDFVLELRAEATDNALAVSAALPLLTVAAHLGELELLYPRG
ncbi:MAG: FUSC family protein, partial [Mycobacterium sp.]